EQSAAEKSGKSTSENLVLDLVEPTSTAAPTPPAPASSPQLPSAVLNGVSSPQDSVTINNNPQDLGRFITPADSIIRGTNQSITLGVVVAPLKNPILPLGADYWPQRTQMLLESGQLKATPVEGKNGYYPPYKQRF
ncbi:MAG: hypothetical protein AAF840_14310, partial [Bacteroidota bacterium]